MKAILLAGADSGRLHPLSGGRPACTLPVLGRSLLARSVRRLALAGVTEFLAVLPEGGGLRTHLSGQLPPGAVLHVCELPPTGAAAACASFAAGEEVWVAETDAVWDFDLGGALALHRSWGPPPPSS